MLPDAQRPAPYAQGWTAAGQRSAAARALPAAVIRVSEQGRPAGARGGAP